MRKQLIDPLIASTYITTQRQAARKRAVVWFNLVALGFLVGIITGHLLFHR
jgi:hypothetical protein